MRRFLPSIVVFSTGVLLLIVVVSNRSRPTSPARSNNDDIAGLSKDLRNVAGTGVWMRVPDGFVEAERFHGLVREDIAASITVNEVPGSFTEAVSGFSPANLRTQGLRVLLKEEVVVGNLPGLFFTLEHRVADVRLKKWCLLFGDKQQSVLVTGLCPPDAPAFFTPVEAAVRSARRGPASEKPLPYLLDRSDLMAFSRRMGSNLMLTHDGVVPVKTPGDPVLIVAPSLQVRLEPPADGQERERAALRLLNSFDTISDLKEVQNAEVKVGELIGVETTARGKDTKSAIPLLVYHVVLFEPNGEYLRLIAHVGEDKREEFLKEFKRLARTLRTR